MLFRIMATFKCEVFKHHRRADGSYPVKLRVTHNRAVRRLPTNLTAYPDDLTRALKIKPGQLQHRCNALIRDCQTAVAEISMYDLPKMTVDDLVTRMRAALTREDWSLDFFRFAYDDFIPKKGASTQRAYLTACHAFARFLGADAIDINEITAALLRDFVEFVDSEPKIVNNPHKKKTSPSSTKVKRVGAGRRNLGLLSAIFNAARRRYNDEDTGEIRIPRSPFERVEAERGRTDGQDSIGVEGLQALIDYQPTRRTAEFARDLFLVSFAFMGVNVADLYNAPPPAGDVWKYRRRKTEKRTGEAARMEVKIPAAVGPCLERLTAGAEPGHWLNLSRRFTNKDGVSHAAGDALKAIAAEIGIEPFTMYAARHTWATVARRKAGIDQATVDECLAHASNFKLADVYVGKDFDALNAANDKVLALFSWKNLK